MTKSLVRLAALGLIALAGTAAFGFAIRDDAPSAESDWSIAEGTPLLDLDWENLVPDSQTVAVSTGVVQHESLADAGSPWQADTDVTAVRAELDGEAVRIPGYMTPLSFDDAEVGEFLLVPYVGACVHVPPPPANQIVYVKVDGTVPILEMWEPFLAVGRLRTDPQSTELAEVGYTMELSHLELFGEEQFEVVDELGNTTQY